jgi:hypothetical protein
MDPYEYRFLGIKLPFYHRQVLGSVQDAPIHQGPEVTTEGGRDERLGHPLHERFLV